MSRIMIVIYLIVYNESIVIFRLQHCARQCFLMIMMIIKESLREIVYILENKQTFFNTKKTNSEQNIPANNCEQIKKLFFL